MKCVICGHKRGKRACPARNAWICPQCCGEKRVLEIDCPEACEYLQAGRKIEMTQEYARHVQTSDPIKQSRQQVVLSRHFRFVNHVEAYFGEERRTSRSLTDKTVAGAIDLVIETLRTEEKGILYDRVSSDLRVDALRRQLQEIVKHYRTSAQERPGDQLVLSDPKQENMRVRDVIDSLEVIREILASHIEKGLGPQSYVNFLARTLPRSEKAADAGPSLIVPAG
jgi:hypothetical protein